MQLVTLTEVCRAKDRLDRLDAMTRSGSDEWASLPGVVLTLDPEARVNSTADLLKQLLASLRLPDKYGRRPQRRGTPRGVYRLNSSTRNPYPRRK
ncbi:hypothetical protein [Nocardioides sp.]|uniref:hypothetical protein n=1 Tax=Nocardioides sp. TaxID=35761 RepID=UPI002D80A683|nr:hypothetical protein [Nocardioides sp.]